MTIVLLVLALVDLAGLGYLAVRLRRLDARERAVREGIGALDPAGTLPPAVDEAFAAGRKVIAVEILNPLELARARNRLAGVAGAVAPGAVRGIVYEQAARLLREQLVEHGVEADVQVLGAGR